MIRYTLGLCCSLIALSPIYAQKASIHVKLLDSSFESYSAYVFEVEIKNDSFTRYCIQDTALLRSQVDYPATGLLNVILVKKVVDEYKPYYKVKRHQGDILWDSCREVCCNCLYLDKGQTIKMNISLLERFILDPGDYMVEVTLDPLRRLCLGCEEIYTDYYFKVP